MTEVEQIFVERDPQLLDLIWWQDFAHRLGWQVFAYLGRHQATFMTKHREHIIITDLVREEIEGAWQHG